MLQPHLYATSGVISVRSARWDSLLQDHAISQFLLVHACFYEKDLAQIFSRALAPCLCVLNARAQEHVYQAQPVASQLQEGMEAGCIQRNKPSAHVVEPIAEVPDRVSGLDTMLPAPSTCKFLGAGTPLVSKCDYSTVAQECSGVQDRELHPGSAPAAAGATAAPVSTQLQLSLSQPDGVMLMSASTGGSPNNRHFSA